MLQRNANNIFKSDGTLKKNCSNEGFNKVICMVSNVKTVSKFVIILLSPFITKYRPVGAWILLMAALTHLYMVAVNPQTYVTRMGGVLILCRVYIGHYRSSRNMWL